MDYVHSTRSNRRRKNSKPKQSRYPVGFTPDAEEPSSTTEAAARIYASFENETPVDLNGLPAKQLEPRGEVIRRYEQSLENQPEDNTEETAHRIQIPIKKLYGKALALKRLLEILDLPTKNVDELIRVLDEIGYPEDPLRSNNDQPWSERYPGDFTNYHRNPKGIPSEKLREYTNYCRAAKIAHNLTWPIWIMLLRAQKKLGKKISANQARLYATAIAACTAILAISAGARTWYCSYVGEDPN